MKYYLNSNDEGKIAYLTRMVSRVLQKMHIPFTIAWVERAAVDAYRDVYESPQVVIEGEGEVAITDRNDPVNLVVALSTALLHFHVKSEANDTPPVVTSGAVLAVCTAPQVGTKVQDLIVFWDGKDSLPTRQEATEYIYVSYQKNSFTGEPDCKQHQQQMMAQRALSLLVVLAILSTLIIAIYQGVKHYDLVLWLPGLLILLTGTLLCYQIFNIEKLNATDSTLVKKFCSGEASANNCKKVLGSKGAKLFAGISMGDIGLVYFVALLCYMINGLLSGYYVKGLSIYGWCTLLALPYTLYSLYYQAKVLKQFCALCLSVQVLLWVQFAWVLYIFPQTALLSFSLLPVVYAGLLAVLVTVVYQLIVKYYASKEKIAKLAQQLYPYQKDQGIFKLLLQREGTLDTHLLKGALVVGNPEAAVQLQVILSPSCLPCSKMFSNLIKLADKLDGAASFQVWVKPEPEALPLFQQLYDHIDKANHVAALQALSDWYNVLAITGDNKAMYQHHHTNDGGAIPPAFLAQQVWFDQQYLPHTPIIIYEGHFLPSAYYDMDLLGYQITLLAEQV